MATDPINIDGVDHKFADLKPYAQKMVDYIAGIDAQLNKISDNMEQLQICREGCYSRLLDVMKESEESVVGQTP